MSHLALGEDVLVVVKPAAAASALAIVVIDPQVN